jgi:hypothetical protein
MTIDEIRRAATVARYYDERAKADERQIRNVTDHKDRLWNLDWLIDVESGSSNMFWNIEMANAIRRSIRAAIGSEKQ